MKVVRAGDDSFGHNGWDDVETRGKAGTGWGQGGGRARFPEYRICTLPLDKSTDEEAANPRQLLSLPVLNGGLEEGRTGSSDGS
jgi:hypothetical protein